MPPNGSDSAGAACEFRKQHELARAVRQVSEKSANAIGVYVYPEFQKTWV